MVKFAAGISDSPNGRGAGGRGSVEWLGVKGWSPLGTLGVEIGREEVEGLGVQGGGPMGTLGDGIGRGERDRSRSAVGVDAPSVQLSGCLLSAMMDTELPQRVKPAEPMTPRYMERACAPILRTHMHLHLHMRCIPAPRTCKRAHDFLHTSLPSHPHLNQHSRLLLQSLFIGPCRPNSSRESVACYLFP